MYKRQVEAVDTADLDPSFELVRHGLRAAHDDGTDAADPDVVGDVARRPLALRIGLGEDREGGSSGIRVDVFEGDVGVVLRQVESRPSGIECQRALDRDIAAIVIELRLSLLVRRRDDDRDQGEDLDRIPRAPESLGAIADVVGDRTRRLRTQSVDEDRLAVLRGELASARGCLLYTSPSPRD